jgi:hypothetical protein
MTSADLVAHLVGLDERPWAEYGKKTGRPITKVQVARLPKPLRISVACEGIREGRAGVPFRRPPIVESDRARPSGLAAF